MSNRRHIVVIIEPKLIRLKEIKRGIMIDVYYENSIHIDQLYGPTVFNMPRINFNFILSWACTIIILYGYP